jgi:hypothetical protein
MEHIKLWMVLWILCGIVSVYEEIKKLPKLDIVTIIVSLFVCAGGPISLAITIFRSRKLTFKNPLYREPEE